MTLQQRIKALEDHNRETLPVYEVTFEDGTQRIMDGLDLLIYADRIEAGAEDAASIKDVRHLYGRIPSGERWQNIMEHVKNVLR